MIVAHIKIIISLNSLILSLLIMHRRAMSTQDLTTSETPVLQLKSHKVKPYLIKNNFIVTNDTHYKYSTVNRPKVSDPSLNGFVTNREWRLLKIDKNDKLIHTNPF
jgi:hypothetical protein